MSWLDDIDSLYGIETAAYPADGDLGRIRRLARVLREAADILQIDLKLFTTVDPAIRHGLTMEVLPLLNNMSDDLKELIK